MEGGDGKQKGEPKMLFFSGGTAMNGVSIIFFHCFTAERKKLKTLHCSFAL